MRRWAIWAALLVVGATSLWAEDRPLKVGVKHAPPFVILEQGEAPRGLSVDLIRAVAARMVPPRTVEFVEHADLKQHLAAVEAGEVDLGIAATTVTAARSERLEFSAPFFTSGLGIVVQETGEVGWARAIFSPEAAKVEGGVALYVLFCALLIWLLERGETFQQDFKRGFPEAIWWTLVTMSTVGYGDYAPKRPLGRVISAVIILSGIALFGVLVAEVTSRVTLSELRPSIQSPDDLAGKRVGVLRDTIAVEAVGLRRGRRIEFATLDEACRALREERVRAVVHDRPLLRYRLQNEPAGLTLVGGAFNFQDYAIAFPLGSEQRRPVNQALLRLREEEAQATYRGLLNRWLGEE